MADIGQLEAFSAEDILHELRIREETARLSAELVTSSAEFSMALDPGTLTLRKSLQRFDDGALWQALRNKQKAIYGVDDREDLFQVADAAILRDADCVVSLWNAADVLDNGNGTSTLQVNNYGTSLNLCASEPFRNQPRGSFCSGFLVAPNLIATAGHCVNSGNVTTRRAVFGFRMLNATTARTRIDNDKFIVAPTSRAGS